MSKTNLPAGKASKIIYWIGTIWLSLGMLSTAVVQLLKTRDEILMITKLGYPVYLLTIIDVWKILGVNSWITPWARKARFPLGSEVSIW